MSEQHDELRRLLGGYLLGGLDESDTDRLDAHLAACDDCRGELDRLAPVPELLQRLPEASRVDAAAAAAPVGLQTRPSSANVEMLLGRMRAERGRASRMRWLAAAAVVLVAAAVGVGVVRGRADREPEALPSTQLVTAPFAAAPGSGMSGHATLTSKLWGVSVSVDVTRLRGQGPFVCQLRDRSGKVQQAAIWGQTPTGNAKVTGASSFQLPEVSAVNIADHEGNVLGSANVSK